MLEALNLDSGLTQLQQRRRMAARLDIEAVAGAVRDRVLTTDQLARVTATPVRTVRYRLDRLHAAGMVDCLRPGRETGSAPRHWWLRRAGARIVSGTAGGGRTAAVRAVHCSRAIDDTFADGPRWTMVAVPDPTTPNAPPEQPNNPASAQQATCLVRKLFGAIAEQVSATVT